MYLKSIITFICYNDILDFFNSLYPSKRSRAILPSFASIFVEVFEERDFAHPHRPIWRESLRRERSFMLPGVGSQSGASYRNGKHVTDVLFLFSSFSFLFEVGVSRNFPRLVPTSLSADTFHRGTPSSFRTSFSVVITSQAWMANDTLCPEIRTSR